MQEMSGIKELYDVSLRLNNPIEIGNRKYDINESILSFSKVDIAQIEESKSNVSANGGYSNAPLINWITDRQMGFRITHGVLSPTSWALLANSKIKEKKVKSVQYYEELETISANGLDFVELKYIPNYVDVRLGAQPNPYNEQSPMGRREELKLKPLPPSKTKWAFFYDIDTGKRIRDYQVCGNQVFFKDCVRRVLADYTFDYLDRIETIQVGNRLFNGFMRMDGKMSVKNQCSGEVSTALIEIPKIRITSALSMNLGKNYDSSTVGDFYFTAYPEENRRNEDAKIMDFTFLETELSGDYL